MSSANTIPLLFLNLGGEMLYILDQRLCAQRIPKDKAFKVMDDIVGIMLNERFLQELFKPQEVYNKAALRQLFEDLAHASIMRLNGESMNKLYDLMTMVFKYQLVMCSEPCDIIFITLNHLDAIRDFVSAPLLHKQIDSAYRSVIETYQSMNQGQLQSVRYSLLNFLQDIHVRVSVFLRDNIQTNEGRFIIPVNRIIPQDCEVPGFMRYYDSNGQLCRTDFFNPCGNNTPAKDRGSMEMYGDRGTDLGCNIYRSTVRSALNYYNHAAICGAERELAAVAGHSRTSSNSRDEELRVGKEELNLLLTQLLGNDDKQSQKSENKDVIYLHLFNNDIEEEDGQPANDVGKMMSIDVKHQGCSDVLQKVYGEMTVASSTTDEDKTREEGHEEESLLDLLDSL